jgi:hypothetical protein
MRYFLLFWLFPVGFLVTWYGLSSTDTSFGFWFFSRDMHDLVFQIYADTLGIAPETIPPLVAKAIILDTFIILGLIALRHWKSIRSHINDWRARRNLARRADAITAPAAAIGPAQPAE